MASLVIGIDVGAATTKALVMRDSDILGSCIIDTGASVNKACDTVIEEAMKKAGETGNKADYVVSTGWGRDGVLFADKTVSEILCHAKGARFLIPQARSIIDIGGQDSKVIGIDENGNVFSFAMNDKCAAGTGRFFEVMANVLEIKLTDIGDLALKSEDPCEISSTCTVFAETEVVAHRATGRSVEDLIGGIVQSVAKRVAVMSRQVNLKPQLIFTGGVAKNKGVKRALEACLGLEMVIPEEPQIVGALGAAIIASEEVKKKEQVPI